MRSTLASLAFLIVLLGCGSSTPSASFSLAVAPTALSLQNGSAAQTLTVGIVPANGFNKPVTVTLAGVPAGIAVTPASLTVLPGQLGQFTVMATSGAVGGPTMLSISGEAAGSKATGTAVLSVSQALSNANVSGDSFDFGGNLVGSTLTKAVVTVINTGTADITLSPTLTGDSNYSIVAAQSCGASLTIGARCVETVAYAPQRSSGSTPQTATLNLGLGNVPAGTAQSVALTGVSAVLAQGTVTSTANPLTAQYSITLPFPGSMTVNFGAGTSYGRTTSARPATTNNQTVTMLVAGMPQGSSYHLQAAVRLSNGVSAVDVDHTFTNGASEVQPMLTAATTSGSTPQSGVEQLSVFSGTSFGLAMTDLAGNVIWSYKLPNDTGGYTITGAKMLPNGDYLLSIGEGSSFPLYGNTPPPNAVIAIREIDLAGNIVREISVNDLTNELQSAGYPFTLLEFHHDVTPLPNGHWLVLSNMLQPYTDLPGYAGVTNVLGDVVVDLDENLKPVWVWNSFDHLDVNRHPYSFPDWTHTNAIIYSPSDHNLIISMRHQNWVMKLDYNDGTGTGNILWHLGQEGDFTLVNGTDPTDWPYAQHYPSLFSSNSSGLFSLGLMDNGDDRVFPSGVTCGAAGNPACLYTTIPVLQIDEGAKTAKLIFHQVLDPSLYSNFGGNTEQLANGNIEYDLCGVGPGSDIFEVTPDASAPQTVWHMHLPSNNVYRGYRIPSLYPGVQW